MKSLLIVLLLVPAMWPLSVDNNIPVAVQQAFYEMYPEAPAPFWESRENALVATFQWESQLTKVFFSENGEWIETRKRLSKNQLPQIIRTYLAEHYPSADYSYIGEVKGETGTLYRVESELPEAIVIKLLSPAGQLLKEEAILLNVPIDQSVAPARIPSLPIVPVNQNR